MTQATNNFLDLALDDYRAARLLLRQGLIAQGATIAATAVEKELRAVLALKGVFTKKMHLCPRLLALVFQHFPQLKGAIDEDFVKFLGKAFDLRYASIDGTGFNIVINQHRTLIQLDVTILTIDSGLRLTVNGAARPTPLQAALDAKDTVLLEDNVPLKNVTLPEISNRQNKMLELRIGANLQTLSASYETEGLNIIGKFCKATDIDWNKTQWQLALG